MMRFARWCVVSLVVAVSAPARAQGPAVFGIDGADMVHDAVRSQIVVSATSRSALEPDGLVWIDRSARDRRWVIKARWSDRWLRVSYRQIAETSPPGDSFLDGVHDSPVSGPARGWVGIGISGPGIQEMSYDLGGTLEASSFRRLSGVVR